MDRDNVLRILGLAQRAGKLVSGEEMVIEAVRKKKIDLILLGSDAGPNTSKTVKDKSAFYNVDLLTEFTVDELSTAIGKNNRVVVGISDKGFKNLILKNLRG